jgi:hypothetical protein
MAVLQVHPGVSDYSPNLRLFKGRFMQFLFVLTLNLTKESLFIVAFVREQRSSSQKANALEST